MDYCDRCGRKTKSFPKNSDICFKCKRKEDTDEEKESKRRWRYENERHS